MSDRPDLGELKPGQRVMVYRNTGKGWLPAEDRWTPAEIVRVGRVWVYIASVSTTVGYDGRVHGARAWRMRKDSQDEGTRRLDFFRTMEQHAWEKNQRRARVVLEENGIRIERHSPWYDREIELADLISNWIQGQKEDHEG